MNRQRGLTLVELLVSLTIVVIVTFAASRAYESTMNYGERMRAGRDQLAIRNGFEERVTDLLRRAYLDPDTTNANTFFVGGAAIANSTPTGLGQVGQTSTLSTPSQSSSQDTGLVLTVIGERVPSTMLASNATFEDNNDKFGPTGGVSEVSLSMTPIGEGAEGATGLFIRRQTPSDSDATQGGTESLMSERVDTVSYEFFDGTAWQTEWDTRTQTTRRLPSAVRVTYRLTTDNDDHSFIVRIPASDVTPDNPVTEAG